MIVIVSKFVTRDRDHIEVCYPRSSSYQSLLHGIVIVSKFVTRDRNHIELCYPESCSYQSLLPIIELKTPIQCLNPTWVAGLQALTSVSIVAAYEVLKARSLQIRAANS